MDCECGGRACGEEGQGCALHTGASLGPIFGSSTVGGEQEEVSGEEDERKEGNREEDYGGSYHHAVSTGARMSRLRSQFLLVKLDGRNYNLFLIRGERT